MATYYGDASGNYFNYSGTNPTYPATGDGFYTYGGNDTVYAGNGNDMIQLGDGNDFGSGGNGSDTLFGDAGADTLYGGDGSDYLFGGTGDDQLWGGPGSDYLRGNQNNDTYHIYMSDSGIDVVQEDLSPANTTGYGGGTDTIIVHDAVGADLRFFRSGDNMLITTAADVADGVMNSGVIVENHYTNALSHIEYVYGSDGSGYYFPFA